LTDDKARAEAQKYLARQLADEERLLLQQQAAVAGILGVKARPANNPIVKEIQNLARKLVTSVVNGKQIANGDDDKQPVPKAKGADPVDLASGQLVYRYTDLRLDGGGITYELVRTYRSQARYPNGPLGASWDHSYNIWLREDTPDVIVVGSGEL